MGVPCIYDRPLTRPPSEVILETHNDDVQFHSESRGCGEAYNILAADMPERHQTLFTLDHNSHAQLDPFQTYPSKLSPDCVSRVLNYSIKDMWPKLFPGFTYKGESFVHEWMNCAMKCPPLFNAWLHSGAEHMQLREQANDQSLQPSTQDNYEILLMEREAILGLKEFVHNSSPDEVTDEIVMCAFALALHPPERKRNATARMRQVPLSNLQWLSRFTDIVIPEGHIRGLRQLVDARGGFDKLEMPGLKQGLSTFNLIVASKYLERPYWPLRARLQPDEVAMFLSAFEPSWPTNSMPLQSCLKSVVPTAMAWEFHAIRGYNALVHEYSQGLCPTLDMAYVLDLRNMVHYHLLSLPTSAEMLETLQDLPPTYESLRLALIAYSLLVLFPIPLTIEPYPRLAHLLRYELELTQMRLDLWMPMIEMLLWVLTIGGISSFETVHRPWYVQRLRWMVQMFGVESWEQLKEIMVSIIWLDTPCDVEGMLLWKEVQESNPTSFVEGPSISSIYMESPLEVIVS
ncbi:hypothetical protein ARAM_002906 [Aspergillus rambellii]|uniref:Uncharacterized protein n=1 Tax=Aspergillus rambellii TaxID=308745 RepID=A0A0F8WS15_9EURO|nr:hypothetical protein ARAM_002906 [Aspergillus rambellii]